MQNITSMTNLRNHSLANLCLMLYQKGRGRNRNMVFHHFRKRYFTYNARIVRKGFSFSP